MDTDLASRHALVCGASQGIGRAVAMELAALGADVTVMARREDVLREVVAELPHIHEKQHHNHIAIDSGDTDGVEKQVRALVQRAPVHILVNNSGGPPPGPVHGARREDFLDGYRKHLLANHVLAEAVIPGMQEAGWGRIINIISTSVKEPIPGIGVSNTTRGAVANWAKTLAGELARFGITVNNVLPGSTNTPRIEQIIEARASKSGRDQDAVREDMVADIPMQRFAEPIETAAAVAFLATPAAAAITGINLPVDGGRTRSL